MIERVGVWELVGGGRRVLGAFGSRPAPARAGPPRSQGRAFWVFRKRASSAQVSVAS